MALRRERLQLVLTCCANDLLHFQSPYNLQRYCDVLRVKMTRHGVL